MKLSALKGGTSSIFIEVPPPEDAPEGTPAEMVEVKWLPGELTLSLYEQMKDAASGPMPDLDGLELFLMPLLSWWDIADEGGNNLPVSREVFRSLPLSFITEVVDRIGEDGRPNPQMARPSGETLPLMEQPDTSQNGTSSSEQQTDFVANHGTSLNAPLDGTTSD